MIPHTPDNLEASVNRVLRSLPDRRAPAGLEARVLAEIARRASLPWWRQSFSHWPSSVRTVFFVGSAAAAALIVSAIFAFGNNAGVAGVASEPFAWLRAFPNALSSTRHTLGEVAAAVPALWIYVGAAVIASLYGILGAIGATTYRVLSTTRATP
jgi:hypothetical protein